VTAGPTARREARERALGLLYEAEVKGATGDAVLRDLPVEPQTYAVAVVEGVTSHLDELDTVIRDHSPRWPLERMPAIDRALLRMGVYELCHEPDVPTGVVLAEAVELAQQYSTDDSARFVNGLLAAVAHETRS
jgi:transcription antitermination protein NusB